jgi:hypothetical protein
VSDPTTPTGAPDDRPDAIRGVPGDEGRPGGAPSTEAAGVPDGDGLPGGPSSGGGPVARWRRTYGASPAHLLVHLAGIALAAYALSQAFDPRYEAVYLNLALWLVGGAVLNDFVALPLYVGIDRVARTAWGRVRPARADHGGGRVGPTALVPGHGHVRFPVVMSAVLLLVWFPNIAHKTGPGYRLTTGLAEPPDYAARWLLITAGLLIASAVIWGLRVAAARAAARRPAAP